jgi:hypothetical protein
VLVLAAGVLAVVIVTAQAPASRLGRSPICRRGMVTVQRDPQRLLPLTADPIAPAAKAALRFTPSKDRPAVKSVELATWDRGRGPEAKFECGARVWRRTVVVYITLRAYLPSASLSERVLFVGRFRDGYRVWQVVH